MAENDSFGPRTPPAIEQLQWSSDQADKRVVQKIEALLNEYAGRVVRFLGIHHKKGRPRAEFERAERRLDLQVKAARNMGFDELADAISVLHKNVAENYDKFALPIRHALDTPSPGEEATDIIPVTSTEKDMLDRLNRR